MKLLLRRDHRVGGMFKDKPVYSLEVRGDLTEEERDAIGRFRLSETVLFERYPEDEVGPEYARSLSRAIHNVTITVGDLQHGKRIEVSSIQEMLGIEAAIKEAATNFKALIEACRKFEGEEVLEL